MFLRSLRVRNFRNLKDLSLEFSPGTNLILGRNAQGKSNILEAIHFLITGTSFRTSKLEDLILQGAPFFTVEATFVQRGLTQTVQAYFDGRRRRLVHNQKSRSSFSSLLGLLQGVTLSPQDHELIKGSPSVRRRFCDLHISQADPLYVYHLVRYTRAMKQRNILLRKRQLETIGGWEGEMARSAAYMTLKRGKAIEELLPYCQKIQAAISDSHDLPALVYQTPLPMDVTLQERVEYYKQQFQRLRHREMEVKATLSGPHKDDLQISVQERDARYFASEGQQRSCAISLRLAEWYRLQKLVEEHPLMIVDDLAVSLDRNRCARLLDHLSHLGQVFVSSAHEGSFPFTGSEELRRFWVEAGEVSMECPH